MPLDDNQIEVIRRCQQSITYFLSNFAQLKHPSAGVLPFVPFKYQKYALGCFRKHKFNIFRKCRQSGISKISGAYALWFSMFNAHKTTLIVSRTDLDAMKFLRENIKFSFDLLPQWMQEMWRPVKDNEHELAFPNGSSIQSLTSSPDVMRSNAASLNIIDEAAFIDKMDVLWAGGWSTLQHGGSAIVISTTNGIGNWYWSTYTDAEAGKGVFNPIVVNWWDMDWAIEYDDSMSGERRRIAPADNIVDTDKSRRVRYKGEEVELDPERYGPKWSPWLEEQYRALQEKGETWKFDQEVLAQFIGTGNTVLPKSVLNYIGVNVGRSKQIAVTDWRSDAGYNYYKVTGPQTYVHPVSGQREVIDWTFGKREPEEEGLFIWNEPVTATPARYKGRELIDAGTAAHPYVMGVDLSTGKAKDYHAFEIFDVLTMEQVAEFMGRCLPRDFKKMVDHVGRWYNTALAVIERNNGGDAFIDEMRYDLMYPRLWRKKDLDDKPKKSANNANPIRLSPYGFFTGQASKPVLNQYMHNFLRDRPGEGYEIKSYRLLKQLQTYVRKRDKAGRDTGKTEAEDGAGNFDDLVIACALGLLGAGDAVITDATSLIPSMASDGFVPGPNVSQEELEQKYIQAGGPALMMPIALTGDPTYDSSIAQQLEQFTMQLGALPLGMAQSVQPTSQRRPPNLKMR